MVRKERLELSRLAALEPKSSASTNSATLACVRQNAKTLKAVLYLKTKLAEKINVKTTGLDSVYEKKCKIPTKALTAKACKLQDDAYKLLLK